MKSINRFAIALASACACSAAGAGQWPAVQVHGEVADSLAIFCARPTLPSQKEVAKVLHVSNFDQTYELRATVMVVAAKACKAGATQVLVQGNGRGPLNWTALN